MLRPALCALLLCGALLLPACTDGDGRSGPGRTLVIQSELVTEADFPVAIAVAPDGRIFFNELLNGDVRIISAEGELLDEPFAHLDIATLGYPPSEWGLIGLALDPQFQSNHYVYVYFMQPVRELEEGEGIITPQVAEPVVMRFTEEDNRAKDPTVILDDLPESDPEKPAWHVAGNIHFGPEGYLYVAIGDMRQAERAVDLTTAHGKILRVNAEDGAPAEGNPFLDRPRADHRVFAYGFRNPFDFTFDPSSGRLYAIDNNDLNCDELNLVEPGEDYGWRGDAELDPCDAQRGALPLHFFAPPGKQPEDGTVAPTGLEYVSGDRYPSLTGSLLVCEWVTGLLRRLDLSDAGDEVLRSDIVTEGCQLSIATAPDGTIYFSDQEQIRRLTQVEVDGQ
jgi:glucose/arabinose dehydrogenase